TARSSRHARGATSTSRSWRPPRRSPTASSVLWSDNGADLAGFGPQNEKTRHTGGMREPGSTYVVYGDFNCPYSRLASARLAVLEDRGEPVEFRAVEHDPAIPGEGIRVVGEVEEELQRELAQIRGMLGPDERRSEERRVGNAWRTRTAR